MFMLTSALGVVNPAGPARARAKRSGRVIGSPHHQARGRMRNLHGQAQRIIGGVDRLLQGLRKKA